MGVFLWARYPGARNPTKLNGPFCRAHFVLGGVGAWRVWLGGFGFGLTL